MTRMDEKTADDSRIPGMSVCKDSYVGICMISIQH